MDEKNIVQPDTVNIEDIMQEIRQQILAKRDSFNQGRAPIVPIFGKRLPLDFYEHLYQASLVYDDMAIKLHVTEKSIPVFGSVWGKLRVKLHELVLFYVNQLAAQQIQFNTHILQAVSLLAQELEDGEQEEEK